MSVAQTILNQLGGRIFICMTGATNFLGSENSLTFKIGRNAKSVSHVRVTLTAMDDYQVEFLRVRAGKVTPVAMSEGIYFDQLREVFTRHTGMATRL